MYRYVIRISMHRLVFSIHVLHRRKPTVDLASLTFSLRQEKRDRAWVSDDAMYYRVVCNITII